MQKNMVLVSLLALGLVGCSSEESEQKITSETKNVSPVTQSQPAIVEVKVEAPKEVPKATPQPVPTPVAEQQPVEPVMPSEPVKMAEKSVMSGDKLYATCVGCHGASGEGGVGPRLIGQAEDALYEKMIGYKMGKTFGPMTAMMAPNVQNMSDDEIRAVAGYISSFR